MSLVELPKKYDIALLSDKVAVLDLETRDVCIIALNPPRVMKNDLRNKRIAQKIVKALALFETYKTPSIKSYL
jgi:hypothetical protein